MLSSCFPRAIVQKSELIATGFYRAQNLEFRCDPARTAIDEGLPLDLNERPLSFGCRAKNSNSIITITIETLSNPTGNSIRVLWSVQDPFSGGIITLDSSQAKLSRANDKGYAFLANGHWTGDFEFRWSEFSAIKGSFLLDAHE